MSQIVSEGSIPATTRSVIFSHDIAGPHTPIISNLAATRMLRNDGDEIVLTSIKDRGIVYCRREVATCGGDSNRTGGLGVASSNLAAPTTIYLVLPNSILTPTAFDAGCLFNVALSKFRSQRAARIDLTGRAGTAKLTKSQAQGVQIQSAILQSKSAQNPCRDIFPR